MNILNDSKKEIEKTETSNTLLSASNTVLKIAKAVDKLEVLHVSRDLIFRLAIQVHFTRMNFS